MQVLTNNESRIAWRTTAFPELEDCANSGWNLFYKLGKHAHIAEMNAAGRQLAAVHGLELIDVETMSVGFNTAKEYLSDWLHTKDFFNYSLLNVYLNMVKDKLQL